MIIFLRLLYLRYLVSTVLKQELGRYDLQELYDFIFDRLRAIRQDLVIQQSRASDQLYILSVCVRFHLVFGQLLDQQSTFSSHINSQHQLDCLKSCVLLEEEDDNTIEEDDEKMSNMKSIYLLSNLDSPHSVSWAVGHNNKDRDLGEKY